MKIKVIGDTHGNPIWKTFIEDIEEYDKIIFLGDYLDAYRFDSRETIDNFKEIIELKLKYPDKVVLLFGNHCIHYIFAIQPCSRYMKHYRLEIENIYKEHLELFQFAYQYENHLFTHAGISKVWFDYLFKGVYNGDYATQLNNAGEKRKHLFAIGPERGGLDFVGGPCWIDRHVFDFDEHLFESETIIQIVGHSKVKKPLYYENMIFIDCLEYDAQPLILNL